ncbi:LuxR C-terminal-related transcriptional regulator [Burkholderia sp. L27(2015)]|uniref:LuxR C-terminal-related transcriptional regulator n=1 Tax=Burkholderia sp. L27(2015) TaxID=1641858 RepID=UPI00131E5F86|nr:LuxR C-terminal-related transcriptional regulator [Burkholderia sp. L27(2015)]
MKFYSELIKLIETCPCPASFKEADTGKYIVNNACNARQFGVLNPKDLNGLTINDLKFAQPTWGAQYASTIEKLDFLASDEKRFVTDRHLFLDDSGEVRYEKLTKAPVLGLRKKILGIVTYRHDLTHTVPLADLCALYEQFYEKPEVITRLLQYFKIDTNFITQPSEGQFNVLLQKARGYSTKEIAKRLDLAPRTVDSHMAALRGKTVDGGLSSALLSIKAQSAR